MLPRGKSIPALAEAFGIPGEDVRAALDGAGGEAIGQWSAHVAHIQDSSLWLENWQSSIPLEKAERFFDLVDEICAQSVNIRELKQRADPEQTMGELLDLMINRATERMEPDAFKELTSLIEGMRGEPEAGPGGTPEQSRREKQRLLLSRLFVCSNFLRPAEG